MKKNHLSLALFLVVFPILLFSCRSAAVDDCTPMEELYEYMKINSSVYENISRNQLVTYSMDTQIVIINSISNQSKKRIYDEHLDSLKKLVSFTPQQLAHIQLLTDYPADSLYSQTPTSQNWIQSWANTAKNSFGWSNSDMFLYFETYYFPIELQNANWYQGIDDGGTGSNAKCNCRYDIGCAWPISNCSSTRCDKDAQPNYACGISGSALCTGKCG